MWRAAELNATRAFSDRYVRMNSSTATSAADGWIRSGRANMFQNCRRTTGVLKVWGIAASSGRSSLTIGTRWRYRRQAIDGESRLRLLTRSGAESPTSIATRPPGELPTMGARLTPSASRRRHTASANQAASYGARIGFDDEPKPGRSIACTVYSGASAETVSKKLVLLLPRP